MKSAQPSQSLGKCKVTPQDETPHMFRGLWLNGQIVINVGEVGNALGPSYIAREKVKWCRHLGK